MNTLKHLFLDELADRYDSEKRLIRAMPKMAKSANCKHLRKLIHSHLKETIEHAKKLEAVFKCFGATVKAKKCHATIGLLEEGAKIADDFKHSPAIDAALISAAQKIEHYEIASYGCLHEWATLLGHKETAGLLKGILAEEEAANQALIKLARSSCNAEALGECNEADASCDGKAAKFPNVSRGMRPVKLMGLRPVKV
jgi:ferritin-like metal-binding protein YciE